MKKYFALPLMAAVCLTAGAQDFDNSPTVNIEKNDMKFTVGARMMGDVAYYHSDFTNLKSGASLTDARIRTSFTYRDWYFYADFGFGGGKFSQKNIFAQWSKENSVGGVNSIKAGYYNDPGSMAETDFRCRRGAGRMSTFHGPQHLARFIPLHLASWLDNGSRTRP